MRDGVWFDWGFYWRCWAAGVVVESNDVTVLLGPLVLHWDWL